MQLVYAEVALKNSRRQNDCPKQVPEPTVYSSVHFSWTKTSSYISISHVAAGIFEYQNKHDCKHSGCTAAMLDTTRLRIYQTCDPW